MASTHVLEVTVVLIFMVSSVTLVSFMSAGPAQPWAAVEDALEQRTWEMLHIANDHLQTPGHCRGATKLEQLVIDGARGDHSNWADWKARFLGPGIEASMFLDNGDALMPLHEPSSFRGVTSDIPYMPDLTYAIAVPAVSTVSGVEDLMLDSAAVRDGQQVRTRGDAIDTVVRYGTVLGLQNERRSMSISAIPSAARAGFGESVFWSSLGGEPQLVGELQGGEATGVALKRLNITIQGSSVGGSPAGTELVISLPSGWHNVVFDSQGWRVIDDSLPVLRVQLLSDRSSSTLSFTAYAPDNTRPFEVIHARLQNGSLGESTLVLTRPSSPLLDRGLPVYVYPTTPYPVRSGSRATFGVVLTNGGDEINVTQVDITVPGGYDLDTHDGQGTDLFETSGDPADAPIALAGGERGSWSVVDSKTLRWTWDDDGDPGEIVPTLGAAEWVVDVKINDDPAAATSIEPATRNGPEATLRFPNAFESVSSRWGASPGVLRHVVPPETAVAPDTGYPIDLNWHTVDVSVEDWYHPVEGSTRYRVFPTASDVASTQNALANSSLRVSSRLVPSGSIAEVRADIDSIAQALGALEVTAAEVELDLYSPITRGCPTRTWETLLDALPAPAITDVLLWDGGTGTPSVFAASSDGQVYRVGAGGTTISSYEFDGVEAKLASGSEDGLPRLFVGDDRGVVHAVDPVLMQQDWSYDLQGLGVASPVTLLHFNQTRDEILVGTRDGDLAALDAGDGSFRGSLLTTRSAVKQIVQMEDGDTYAFVGNTIYRLDEDLRVLASATTSDALGFAVTPSYVWSVRPHALTRWNKDTLAHVSTNDIEGRTIALATHGDANMDGAYDLIMATAASGLIYISGATGHYESLGGTYQPLLIQTDTNDYEGDVDLSELECHPTTTTGGYTSTVTCGLTIDEGGPRILTWRPGMVGVHLIVDGVAYVWVVGPDGSESQWTSDEILGALSLGQWGATAAFAAGSVSGMVHAVEAWTSTELAESSPSARVGDFSFYMHMPLGGFYGTHVVVLTVAWETGGKYQHARMMDWFEVTDRWGKPVRDPSYRVAVVTQDGSAPMDAMTG